MTLHFHHLFQMVVMKSVLKITHVIFDLDGLLVDTEIVFSKVNQCLLSKYGKEFTSHLRGLVTGMPKKAAVTYILEHVCLFLHSLFIAAQDFQEFRTLYEQATVPYYRKYSISSLSLSSDCCKFSRFCFNSI